MIGIGWAVNLALSAGVPEKFAKPVAIVGLAIIAGLLFWGAIAAWKSDIVQDAVNEANVEFAEDKDQATGKADQDSDARQAEHKAKAERTQELIDEALENGCVVADYLHSNGAECVWPDDNPIQGSSLERSGSGKIDLLRLSKFRSDVDRAASTRMVANKFRRSRSHARWQTLGFIRRGAATRSAYVEVRGSGRKRCAFRVLRQPEVDQRCLA